MLKLAIIAGGPSKERGISLNSARSFLDHSEPLNLELLVIYVDPQTKFHLLPKEALYSNTPSDFDFKLAQVAKPLENLKLLQEMDLVFPLVHGSFGEDGTLQKILEEIQVPFVGSSSEVCKTIFNKGLARKKLHDGGFATLPGFVVRKGDAMPVQEESVIKPTCSGSSIGVVHVKNQEEATFAASSLFEEGFSELVIEPYCKEREFTICVLNGVALIPLEIDKGQHPILDFRKKYLPCDQTRYYCPPRFDQKSISKIRLDAMRLYSYLSLRDFARIDGWLCSDGKVCFSDLNPISGMEQNSFIFQQASQVGLNHTDLIETVINAALMRYGKEPIGRREKEENQKKPIFVLMGGKTAERQVSLMSGTNVWLKLLHSHVYEPIPFLLDFSGSIWRLPYSFALHHTVEEVLEHCQRAKKSQGFFIHLVNEIRSRLGFKPLLELEKPQILSFNELIQATVGSKAFLFLALHGGSGEDGTIQKKLEDVGVPFNGSKSKTSQLCMDKYLTARAVEKLMDQSILAMEQICFDPLDDLSDLWEEAVIQLGTSDLIIKPNHDGCSSGIIRLCSEEELFHYITLLKDGVRFLLPGSFKHQSGLIEMPRSWTTFILEPFITTDKIHVQGCTFLHESRSGWHEMTIGVIEKEGVIEAFVPSITVAAEGVLSLEEKFQGGTGINITPPPKELLSDAARAKVQESVCKVAKALGINNYARLDLFVEGKSGQIRVIEVNSLPALTPSTVLYHQALAADLHPRGLLEKIINEASR